ncbi:MAG: M28 family peptidase [Polyangiaceae bacterium]|nr:M28 family peptidase [Polyangiaceae bacterium]
MTRALPALALAALVLCWGLVSWRLSPPAAKPSSAPAAEFSAERGYEALRRVLPTSAPHPTGSAEQRRVRARIEAELARLGWSVRVQRAPACSRFGTCAVIENVIADRSGATGPRVLLAAHYDSVPAGPGGSDDGIGVATLLEIARALPHGQTRLPVMLLLTDGEEAGLLGAEAFVRDELGRQAIAAVINVEARGTTGPSLLFETSGPNDWLVRAFAAQSPHPIASSLFPAVYQRLPNDTDLSVFRRAGVPGVNFANIGGVGHYHTPFDDLDRVSLRTMQHHGDATLGLARALGTPPPAAQGALFFDLLGLCVVRVPLGLARWGHGLASLVWLLVLGRELRRGARTTRVLKALGGWPLAVLVATVASFGLSSALRVAGALGSGWPAHPAPYFLAVATGLIVITLAALAVLDASVHELWLATWTFFGLVGWAAVALLPEAGFLFTAPWLLAALTGLIGRGVLSVLTPAIAAALLWLPVLSLAYDALGLAVPGLLSATAALGLAGFVPACVPLAPRPRRFAGAWSAATALSATAVGCLLPAHGTAEPQRLSIAYHLDATRGRARFLVDASSGPVPKAVLAVERFSPEVVDSAPTFVGWRSEARQAEAPAVALSPPVAEHTGPGRWRVRSERGAETLSLHFAEGAQVTFQGMPAALRRSTLTLLGVGPGGAVVETAHPFALSDHSPGLPSVAQRLADARPEWAVPSQAGDETVVTSEASH